jgi:hypothetical protein
MKRSTLTLVMVMATVAVLGLIHPATAAEDQPFYAAEDTAALVGYDGAFQVWVGAGTGTHVGQFTTLSYVHVKGYSGKAEGTIEITAANGDVLCIEQEATWYYETARWVGTYQIVGGTGRFEGASGEGDLVVAAPDYALVLDGSITY